MMLRDLLPKIEKIILPFLESSGLELVEITSLGKGKTSVIRVTIWKKGGVGIDDITKVSRHLGDILDQEDIIPGKYTLEVSSPGLDRELKTEADFRRAEGEKIAVTKEDGTKIEGEVCSAEDGNLVLIQGEEQFTVPIAEITKGQIVIEF
ncbi:MAG TPA: ribosome maturation factor RimP [candidate division Zixibacteria bacterium]|nr:ribosome maturation factor RimP [candidate division Zixibacteria bacterium]